MRVRKARAGRLSFVDESVQVALRHCGAPPLPGLRNEIELLVDEFADRTRVPWHMNRHLLAVECRVQIGNDAYLPGPALGKHEGVRRRTVLAAGAERALLELLGRQRVKLWCRRARTSRTRRGDRDAPARQRVKPKIGQRARGRA
jgi:hypothetical protein